MRFLTVVFLVVSINVSSQNIDSLLKTSSSILKKLKLNDSLYYYQCHVEEAVQELTTSSGQVIKGDKQKYTITEKFVIVKSEVGLNAKYYTSSLSIFPNKKFSGLKIREKPYWNFKFEKSFTITENMLKILLALEAKGRDAMEYDYAISKYTTNQLIIKYKKDFKQLIIEGDYFLSKLVSAKLK